MTDEEYAAAILRTRCSRCPATSVDRVTTRRGGKERVCATCKWAILFDEAEKEAARKALLAAAPRPAKAFSNIDRVNRMCAAFGLESPFKNEEPL